MYNFSKRGVAGAVALLTMAGCDRGGRPQAVVYTSVDQVYAETILKRFSEESGISVLPVYDVEAAKTTGLVNRLIAERSRPRADVFWNGEFVQTLKLKAAGLLAAYASPSAAGLPAAFADPEHFWTGAGARCRVLLYRRGGPGASGIPPRLSALPGAGARAGIALPLFGTSASHAAALYASDGPELARPFFESIRARGVRVVDGNSVVRDLVASGSLAVGLTDSDDACGALGRNAAVTIELPDQDAAGTLVIPGSVALVAGGPNPREGKQLVDYLLSARTERALIDEGFCQLSLRNLERPAGCLEGRTLKAMAVDPEGIFRHFDRSRNDMERIFVR